MTPPAAKPSGSGALSGGQLQRATGLIAGAFILSGLLGVVRGAIIGARFGAGTDLDAFYAAFRIPEMLFNLVAGGALGSAFIPTFGRFLAKDETEAAWRLASAVMTLVALIATLLAVIAGILAPWITAHFLVPEAAPEQQALTAELMRIMLATVLIFSLSGLIMGILNANQHFLTPALAPSMNNLGLIIGALFLAPTLGVYGLALGAVLGALLHLGIQIPALRHIHPQLRVLPDYKTPGVLEVLGLMAPRVLGSAVVQINFLVNTILSSGMVAGSLSALNIAFGLMFTILGVLGQSVGTAVFPSLVALSGADDMDGFRSTLSDAIRGILFLSLPASVGLIVLAVPAVATIYQHNNWTADDTLATAWALQFFALGLAGFALQEVLARAFFALHDTATPVAIGVGGMLLNVALSLLLIHVVQGQPYTQGPFGGLALANTLATALESLALWIILRRRLTTLFDQRILWMAARTLLASLIMGAVVWFIADRLAESRPIIVLAVGALAGIAVFEIAALSLGLSEARRIPMMVLRRFKR